MLSLDSQLLSLIYHLKFRSVCCASASLGIQGTFAWPVLGVPWYPPHQINQLWFFFAGGSAPSFLGVLGHGCLACPWISSALFLSAFQALPGDIYQLSLYQGDPILQESSMILQTDCSCPLHLYISAKGQGAPEMRFKRALKKSKDTPSNRAQERPEKRERILRKKNKAD